MDELELIDAFATPYHKYPLPYFWAVELLAKAHREGRIDNEAGLRDLNAVSRFTSRHKLINSLRYYRFYMMINILFINHIHRFIVTQFI